MSWLFAQSQDIDVVGLVLIDASYLKAAGDLAKFGSDGLGDLFPNVPPSTKKNMEVSIEKTRSLVLAWEPPQWLPSSCSTIVAEDDGPSRVEEASESSPPPTALLYAKEFVPSFQSSKGEALLVDACRLEPMLGWTKYDAELISIASRVDGHHFTVFDKQHVRCFFLLPSREISN